MVHRSSETELKAMKHRHQSRVESFPYRLGIFQVRQERRIDMIS